MIQYTIYLLTAFGQPAGGSGTIHIYTHTHTHTHTHTQYTERHKTNKTQNNTNILEECGPCPVLCGFYRGICLTTEERARKSLSQGSRIVPAGTMKIYKHTKGMLPYVQLFGIEQEIVWLILGLYFQCFPQNETPRCIRNPTQSKYRTNSSNRTFQHIAVYLPTLAVRRPSDRCTRKTSTDTTRD